MKVRRRLFYPTQWKGLDRSLRRRQHSVDRLRLVEALHLQVMHQVVGVIGRNVTDRAVRLAEEERLAAQLRLAGLRRVETAIDVKLRRGRKVEQFLHLGHEMNLAAALQRVDAFLGGDDLVAVEVSAALFELGEVFNRSQSALRTEEALDIDSAQGGRVYPPPVSLRADVADQMRPSVGVAVDVTIEACHPAARPFSAAVFGDVELLLRELRREQA